MRNRPVSACRLAGDPARTAVAGEPVLGKSRSDLVHGRLKTILILSPGSGPCVRPKYLVVRPDGPEPGQMGGKSPESPQRR